MRILTEYSHDLESEGGEASTSSSRKKPKSTKMTTMSKTMGKTLLQTASWQTHIRMTLKNWDLALSEMIALIDSLMRDSIWRHLWTQNDKRRS